MLGNALQLRGDTLHQQLEGWAREHGPVYRWSVMGRQFLTVTDHKVIASLLKDRPDGFNRPSRAAQISAEMGLDPGVFRANGEHWQRQRRLVMSGLDPTRVKAYLPSMERVANRLLRRWEAAAANASKIDLQADLMRYTVDTIAGLAFGSDVNTLGSQGEVIQDHLDKIFPAMRRRLTTLFPYWRYFKRQRDREMEQSVGEVNVAIARFIAQARAQLAETPQLRERPANLLQSMIVAAEDGSLGISDREVAGNVLTMLLAGEDTTANSLAWMIDLLWRNPQALARTRDEIRALVPPGRVFRLDAERLPATPWLDACIQEAMRLKPVAPFIPVESNRAMTVAGVEIPARTQVFCLLRHDTLKEPLFQDADAFRPLRWIDGEVEAAGVARVSMPFGGGARICPGRYLALLEMRIAMMVLLGYFDIEDVSTPDGAPPAEIFNVTMAPVGLRMRLKDRPT
ncbi:MAG: cytochrome P450 [Pseudomonadota bacterium]